MVLKSKCEELKGTCENPQFPNWAWRFNRNQHTTPYNPWQIREERMPPHYRNMGMHRDFRFHPNDPRQGRFPMTQLGVNLCHDMVSNRQPGFGNSALGRTAGPAPPRLMEYSPPAGDYTLDDFYAVNQVHLISPGMSMHSYQPLPGRMGDEQSQPINPSHYLEKTLGQHVDIPGTFPHFNKPLPTTSLRPPRICTMFQHTGCGNSSNLMERWRARQEGHLERQIRDRCCFQDSPYLTTGVGTARPAPAMAIRQCVTNRR